MRDSMARAAAEIRAPLIREPSPISRSLSTNSHAQEQERSSAALNHRVFYRLVLFLRHRVAAIERAQRARDPRPGSGSSRAPRTRAQLTCCHYVTRQQTSEHEAAPLFISDYRPRLIDDARRGWARARAAL